MEDLTHRTTVPMLYLLAKNNSSHYSKTMLRRIPYRAILTTPAIWAVWLGAIGNFAAVNLMFLFNPKYFSDGQWSLIFQEINIPDLWSLIFNLSSPRTQHRRNRPLSRCAAARAVHRQISMWWGYRTLPTFARDHFGMEGREIRNSTIQERRLIESHRYLNRPSTECSTRSLSLDRQLASER